MKFLESETFDVVMLAVRMKIFISLFFSLQK